MRSSSDQRDRQGLWSWRGRSAVAAGTLAVAALAGCDTGSRPPLAGQAVGSSPAAETPAAETPAAETPAVETAAAAPSVAELSSPRPVADAPEPVMRAGAAARFVSCDGAVQQGGWSPDFGGPAPASDAAAALEAFLGEGPFDLPTTGYRQRATDGGRVLFTYEVGADAKVAVVVADAVLAGLAAPDGSWVVETFATCDPAEYAPPADDELARAVWTDRNGDRVATAIITSFPGPEHCDWQAVTFLQFGGRQYLRDPGQRLARQAVAPYDAAVVLPDDAVDTGFRRGDDALWLAADASIAYLVTGVGVEAWPSTTDRLTCL